MCDETTDVAIKKELIMYARYLGPDKNICTSFIGMMEIKDGCAKTILSAIHELCEQKDLDIDRKLVAFGSDGAAVMIGVHNGVAALLKQRSP